MKIASSLLAVFPSFRLTPPSSLGVSIYTGRPHRHLSCIISCESLVPLQLARLTPSQNTLFRHPRSFFSFLFLAPASFSLPFFPTLFSLFLFLTGLSLALLSAFPLFPARRSVSPLLLLSASTARIALLCIIPIAAGRLDVYLYTPRRTCS